MLCKHIHSGYTCVLHSCPSHPPKSSKELNGAIVHVSSEISSSKFNKTCCEFCGYTNIVKYKWSSETLHLKEGKTNGSGNSIQFLQEKETLFSNFPKVGLMINTDCRTPIKTFIHGSKLKKQCFISRHSL